MGGNGIEISSTNTLKFLKYCGELSVDPDKLGNIKLTYFEKEIIKNFIKQEIDVIPENKSDDNISVESEDDDTDVIKLNDPNFNDNTNKRKKVKNKEDITFSPMKLLPFQQNGKYNAFFVIAVESDSLNNLKFATLNVKKTAIIFTKSYYIYNSYLIKILEDNSKKGNKFSTLLFQVVSNKPFKKLYLFIKDKKLENDFHEGEIPIEKENDNYFTFKDIEFDTHN